MPVTLVEFVDEPECHGHEWHIADEDELARLVACLVLGQHVHVSRIIAALSERTALTHDEMIDNAINQLSTPATDSHRWNRDGWVFQMISWIAASLTINGDVAAIRAPHPRPADKGLDGIIVYLTASAENIQHVVICEDKATADPRNTITSKVWPEFKDFETGRRDAEIVSDVQIALGVSGYENAHELVESVHWNKRRHYRLSITAFPKHDNPEQRRLLFQGYSDKVTGDIERRGAELILFQDVRGWMDGLCLCVVEHLRAMREVNDV